MYVVDSLTPSLVAFIFTAAVADDEAVETARDVFSWDVFSACHSGSDQETVVLEVGQQGTFDT